DDRFAVGDEHRHEPLRILGEISLALLLACDQADLDAFIGETLEVQRDADAEACRGTEIIVKNEQGHVLPNARPSASRQSIAEAAPRLPCERSSGRPRALRSPPRDFRGGR